MTTWTTRTLLYSFWQRVPRKVERLCGGGGATKRTQFSPQGGNGVERSLCRRVQRQTRRLTRAAFSWPGLRPRRKWRFLCSFSLPPSLPCRPSLWPWAPAWACGASSISWRATAPTTPAPMLMCHKVTHKNLIDNRLLFRNLDDEIYCTISTNIFQNH